MRIRLAVTTLTLATAVTAGAVLSSVAAASASSTPAWAPLPDRSAPKRMSGSAAGPSVRTGAWQHPYRRAATDATETVARPV
ncbi:hypothetical protein [Streptomyces sp. NPDC053720]|uniref:hypothetical protein n=1 Tax=Streptomyces sp. NPDC053720 TaxID=3154855 RepID=UPI00343E57F8